MSDKEDAKQFQFSRIGRLINLFQEAHGRAATSPEELDRWLASPEGRLATTYGHRQTR